MTTQLYSLKQHSIVVADTGDVESIARLKPQDATTNPSLLLKSAQDARYRPLLDAALAQAKAAGEDLHGAIDRLFVAFPHDEPVDLPEWIGPNMIDESKLLLLEDGHCLKDHALAACNRPELRASATMMGTSLHTLIQMVDNGLGVTMLPEMALAGGILEHTNITARPLQSDHAWRDIALVWRKNSPREKEFHLLAEILRDAADHPAIRANAA
mgnify:CR=1 FL=1